MKAAEAPQDDPGLPVNDRGAPRKPPRGECGPLRNEREILAKDAAVRRNEREAPGKESGARRIGPYSPTSASPYFFIFARRVFRAIPRRRAVSRILPWHWERAAEMSWRS